MIGERSSCTLSRRTLFRHRGAFQALEKPFGGIREGDSSAVRPLKPLSERLPPSRNPLSCRLTSVSASDRRLTVQ